MQPRRGLHRHARVARAHEEASQLRGSGEAIGRDAASTDLREQAGRRQGRHQRRRIGVGGNLDVPLELGRPDRRKPRDVVGRPGDRFHGLDPHAAAGDDGRRRSMAAMASLWLAVPTSALTRHGSSTEAPARWAAASASASRSAGTTRRPSIHAWRRRPIAAVLVGDHFERQARRVETGPHSRRARHRAAVTASMARETSRLGRVAGRRWVRLAPKPEGRRRVTIGRCVGWSFLLMACLAPALSDAQTRPRRPAAPAKPAALVHHAPDAGRDEGQAGRRRDARAAPSSSSCCRRSRPITSATSSQQARQGALRQDDLPQRLADGAHPGRRPALQGPGQTGDVWHRRPRYAGAGVQPRAGDARRGRGRAAAGQARQRRQPVLRRRHRPGRAQRDRHGVWPRRRGPRGRAGDLRGAGGREGKSHRADRDRSRSPSATRRRRSRCRFRPRPWRSSPSTAR